MSDTRSFAEAESWRSSSRPTPHRVPEYGRSDEPFSLVAPLVDGDHFIVNRNALFLRTLTRPRRMVAAMRNDLVAEERF